MQPAESQTSDHRRAHTIKLTHAMESYASSSECRRATLLAYLGESDTVETQIRCCDICTAASEEEPEIDVSSHILPKCDYLT